MHGQEKVGLATPEKCGVSSPWRLGSDGRRAGSHGGLTRHLQAKLGRCQTSPWRRSPPVLLQEGSQLKQPLHFVSSSSPLRNYRRSSKSCWGFSRTPRGPLLSLCLPRSGWAPLQGPRVAQWLFSLGVSVAHSRSLFWAGGVPLQSALVGG